MNHTQKVARHIAEMEEQGVKANACAPPAFRLMWALGMPVPPPLFLGYIPLAILFGIPFGAAWGVVMWFVQWRVGGLPVQWAIVGSAAAGLLFGLFMAAYYRWKASRYRLPPWKNYPPA